MAGLKVGKADREDIDTTRNFLQKCETFWDNRYQYSLRSKEDEWERWEDDDEEKKKLLAIRKGLSIEEGCRETDVDNRLIIYEYIKQSYHQADSHWMRVVWAADILIENCCDPTEDHLAFYPGLELSHVATEQ